MNEENMNENVSVEAVEADIVSEGEKTMTMEDIPESVRSEYDGSDAARNAGAEADFSAQQAEGEQTASADNRAAGTNYEQSVYVENTSKVMGILSLILGILSCICCCAWGMFGLCLGVAALVLGILSIKREPDGKTLATVGIVCGSIGILISLVWIIVVGIVGFASDVVDSFPNLYNLGDL